MSILLKQSLILALRAQNTCSGWSQKIPSLVGLEGGIRPAFVPLKVFLRIQHGLSYKLTKSERSHIWLKDGVAEREIWTV